MINFNGALVSDGNKLAVTNRGLNYGDGVFETIKWNAKKLLFLEDHYFRLMASMRIMRLEIPMAFTLEFFKEKMEEVLQKNELLTTSARVKVIVWRNEGGFYTPKTNTVSYLILAEKVNDVDYVMSSDNYVVDLYKDYYISYSLLSTLKTTNKALNVLASIYAKENGFNNCLLLNTDKKIVEAINGNLFLVKGNVVKTPPISDGCLNGIMRKQVIALLKADKNYVLEEASVSPFELQKADELFLTNVIAGITPITNYRKKTYNTAVTATVLDTLNTSIKVN